MNPTHIHVEGVADGGTVIGKADNVTAQTVNMYSAGMHDSIADYYAELATECKLHTVHAATNNEPAQRVSPRTAQVYVTPDVWIAEILSKSHKADGLETIEARARIPLSDCLTSTQSNFQRIVLTASSGMGKTTIVNMQVVSLARSGSAPWMVLRLPSLLGFDLSGTKLVTTALERDIQAKLTKNANDSATIARELIKRLDATPGVILFDALEAERQRVVAAVIDFLDARDEAQSGHRVVLTSRPYAYQGDSLSLLAKKGFTRVELAPFTSEQRSELIDQYFSKVVRRPEIGEAMKQQVASGANGDIAILLEEPMLLTYACMLAAVTADGAGNGGGTPAAPLPNTRYKLFDGLVSLMLEKWDSRRALGLVKSFRVLFESNSGRSALRKILEQAAYWEATWEATQRRVVHENQMTALNAPKILLSHERLVALTDEAMPSDLPVRARDVVNWLAERSGLIRRVHEGGGMGYQLHKQLVSFLAVGELRASCKDDYEFAQRLVDTMRSDPEWFRQVLVMGLARLADNPRALETARDAVLRFSNGDGPDPAASSRYWEALAVFAVARHEAAPTIFEGTNSSLDPSRDRERALLLELIETQRLTPAVRAEVADALAALGDQRFDERKPHQWAKRIHDESYEPIPGFVRVPFPNEALTTVEEKNATRSELSTNDAASFFIARTLTTVAQYAKFIEGDGYKSGVEIWGKQGLEWRSGRFDSFVRNEDYKRRLSRRTPDLRTEPWNWAAQRVHSSRPVTGVSWFEARAYARWLNCQMRSDIQAVPSLLGYVVNLPLEGQWVRAARAKSLTAADSRSWPWGGEDEKDVPRCANVAGSGIGHVSAVGVFAPNPLGLFDMAGNAWEWMDNLYSDSLRTGFMRIGSEQNLKTDEDIDRCDLPSLRGGSWIDPPDHASCSYRAKIHPGGGNSVVGFRVVLSPAQRNAQRAP